MSRHLVGKARLEVRDELDRIRFVLDEEQTVQSTASVSISGCVSTRVLMDNFIREFS